MSSFRQIDERHVSSEIALMEWSPKMDLIALATVLGEVLLHRLSWQKVWMLPSLGTKEKEVKVNVIAWRPDGRVLAVAYETGKVVLCDVENSDILHSLDLHCPVTSMNWVSKTTTRSAMEETVFYTDRSTLFLPKLPSLSKSYGSVNKQVEENVEDAKKLKGQTRLNILAIGNGSGVVQLFAFGMFLCGMIDVSNQIQSTSDHKKVISVALSEDFKLVTVIVETKDNEENFFYVFVSYNVPLLQKKDDELMVVALKYGRIASLLAYLSSTIRAISEAWEDILLEIDSKLMTYAEEKKRVSEGTISDDFLELLMFGTPSDALEKFLLHDLTEKGLKKLGHSIELSYSNIQKLVLKHLQSVANALFYHLSEMKGMALWHEIFEELGLSTESVNQAIFSVGSFLLKATEIQQVIDNSMKNFKAFFRWLYAVILRLSDEPVPAEITKVTQQDLNFVAEFLKENFTSEWDQDKKSTFKLERVGQYLKMENLPFPPAVVQNPWIKYLNEHPILRESDMIFDYQREKSLVQQHVEVQKEIEAAFKGPWTVFGNSVCVRNHQILFQINTSFYPKISHVTCLKNGYMYSTFTSEPFPSTYLYVMRESLTNVHNLESACLSFGEIHSTTTDLDTPSGSEKCNHHKILDVKFYNEETITVLLLESQNLSAEVGCPILVQLSLKNLYSGMKMTTDVPQHQYLCQNLTVFEGGLFVDKASCRRLENVKASKIAVSGSRKVACVLFASRRRVRLFEMDVEDEEEDQEETEQDDSVMRDYAERDESSVEFGACQPQSSIEEDKENSI